MLLHSCCLSIAFIPRLPFCSCVAVGQADKEAVFIPISFAICPHLRVVSRQNSLPSGQKRCRAKPLPYRLSLTS